MGITLSPRGRRRVCLLTALVLAAFGAGCDDDEDDDDEGGGQAGVHCESNGETEALADAKLYIEFNATDDDIGVHGLFGGEPWAELCIYAPDGSQVLGVRPEGPLGALGLSDIFFESNEPPADDFDLDDLKADFPAGEYSVRALGEGGVLYTAAARFTHAVPTMPEVTNPAGLVDDPDEGEPPAVAIEGLVIQWEAVEQSVDGDPVDIVGYEVIITDEEAEHPEGLAQPVYDVHIPGDQTELVVAEGFLRAGRLYELEVLAIEASGNQTIFVGFFEAE